MDPAADLELLRQLTKTLSRRAVPSRNKPARIRAPGEIWDAVLAEMQHIDRSEKEPSLLQASRFSDAMILGFLVWAPIRRKNLAALLLGTHLTLENGCWSCTIPGSETKDKTPLWFCLPRDTDFQWGLGGLPPFIPTASFSRSKCRPDRPCQASWSALALHTWQAPVSACALLCCDALFEPTAWCAPSTPIYCATAQRQPSPASVPNTCWRRAAFLVTARSPRPCSTTNTPPCLRLEIACMTSLTKSPSRLAAHPNPNGGTNP